jgi:hypothetical protein
MARAVAGDLVNDQLERVGLIGVEFVQKRFGRCDLRQAGLPAGKGHLPGQIGQRFDTELCHKPIMVMR